MITKNSVGKYLLYALGEIGLVVVGILIALQVNEWNDNKRTLSKEINILKSFDLQFENDLIQFEECLSFHEASEKSIDILLNYLENDLPYNDSLAHHFFISTRIYVDSDMANNVFETLLSYGVDLISNEKIRNEIVLIYEDEDLWIKNFETMYNDFIMNASEDLFPTRFEDFWNGDYNNRNFVGGNMIPLNFEELKNDQEYLYYLRTQKNQLGWMIKRPILDTKLRIISLQSEIRREIERLENK